MSFGPDPWQQQSWDARAAGNFIGGGAGCGLLLAAALAGVGADGEAGLRTGALLLAMGLVAAGLLCVWAEIGRPWRAVNVLFHPQTSWMSREAAVAPLLLASAAAALWRPALLPAAAALAGGFLYCQARILQAARGVPAWREPLTVPLLIATGLAEGAGLYVLLAAAWSGAGSGTRIALAGLLLLRWALLRRWQQRLAGGLQLPALRAVDRAALALRLGSLLPLALITADLFLPAGLWSVLLQVLAGGLAALAGALFKFRLITRAGFNQGFALRHLPVRGVRR
jgi:phenylacetyl-CoA:acceptor oxidoreductase subunit 2